MDDANRRDRAGTHFRARLNGSDYEVCSRAVNAIGPGEWSDPRVGRPAVPAGYPVPDPTVTFAGLVTQLAAWNDGWNATIPAGKTAASERFLRCSPARMAR